MSKLTYNEVRTLAAAILRAGRKLNRFEAVYANAQRLRSLADCTVYAYAEAMRRAVARGEPVGPALRAVYFGTCAEELHPGRPCSEVGFDH